jgi:hypothetical protein
MAMGGLHFVCTVVYLVLAVSLKVPIDVQVRQLKGDSFMRVVLGAFTDILWDHHYHFSWRLTLLIVCGVSLFLHVPWLYSFLILDFFCQSPALATVLRGITASAQPLAMTFLGAAIVTYVYAAIGFRFFRDDLGDYCKDNISMCLLNMIYQGTRAGIVGLGTMMDPVMAGEPSWAERMTYDVSYFVIFGIMIVNTIVALIVDSFGAQRNQSEARRTNRETETFISCLDRKTIDTAAQAMGIADGFTYHEEQKQNKWDYLSFIFYLREKDEADYTGPEEMIRNLVEKNDIKWLPISRSKIVEGEDSQGTEDITMRIEKRVVGLQNSFEQAKLQRNVLLKKVGQMSKLLVERFDSIREVVLGVQAGVLGGRARS